jgi:hypothetical protein
LIFSTEIKEQSFKGEVIFSAIITTIIFGLQLLHSMKNYKDNVRHWYKIYSYLPMPPGKPVDDEIIPKSVQYPAFILRYLLGGFVICFNLILFMLIMSQAIRTRITSFKWTLISIISVIFVYGLHKIINLAINKLFTNYNSQGQNDVRSREEKRDSCTSKYNGSTRKDESTGVSPVLSSVRLDRPYGILLYFNLISSKSVFFFKIDLFYKKKIIQCVNIASLFYRCDIDYYSFDYKWTGKHPIHASN